MKKVGVLALQGDFAAHKTALERAGATPVLVRAVGQFQEIDALVIPGGESTTMLKLLRYDNMMEALRRFADQKPVFGTCAGTILLAKEVSHPQQESLAAMDIGVERNAYGRQNESSISQIDPEPDFRNILGGGKIEAVFIRAPIIRRVGAGVDVLIRHKGDPVLVAEGRHMAATFHPELTGKTDIHSLFLSKI